MEDWVGSYQRLARPLAFGALRAHGGEERRFQEEMRSPQMLLQKQHSTRRLWNGHLHECDTVAGGRRGPCRPMSYAKTRRSQDTTTSTCFQ